MGHKLCSVNLDVIGPYENPGPMLFQFINELFSSLTDYDPPPSVVEFNATHQ